MRKEDGSDEAKVFNLVRGLRKEADVRDDAPVLDGLLEPDDRTRVVDAILSILLDGERDADG